MLTTKQIQDVQSRRGKTVNFGQRDSSPKMSVIPTYVQTNTPLYFNISDLDPNTNVTVQIIDPNGTVVYKTSMTTNTNGSIGGSPWVPSHQPAGVYRLMVKGTCRGKEQIGEQSFKIL